MSTQGTNDDCYFYYYSSCTKGGDCPFRHSRAALGTETVCSLWREGRCFRENCKFRHMESRINRSSIPCYWENQPTGCRKPHCVFLHQKSRLNIKSKSENKGLILPVSTNTAPSKGNDVNDPLKNTMINSPVENYSNHSDDVAMSPHPVEPFVVSFDEGEESDSESVSSTPMKSSSSESKYNSTAVKRNLKESLSDDTNFGIKTLEQIRMEKIHRESEHFYKSDDATGTVISNNPIGVNRTSTFIGDIFSYSAYDAPTIDAVHLKNPDIIYRPESYPPESEFISVTDRVKDKSSNGETNHLLPDKERDLRSRLLKRKSPTFMDKNTVPAKKVVNLRNKKVDDPLSFKVKTLDEIRKEKERENKSGANQEKTSSSFVNQKSPLNSISVTNGSEVLASSSSSIRFEKPNGKSAGKIKIKRMSNEVAFNHNISNQANTNEIVKKESRNQMILHEVQNISEDQTKTDSSTGKRKEIHDTPAARNCKYSKIGSSSFNLNGNDTPLASNETSKSASEEKPVLKPRRPIIKRMSLTSPPLSTSNLTPSFEVPNTSRNTLVSTFNDSPAPAKSETLIVNNITSLFVKKSSVDKEASPVVENASSVKDSSVSSVDSVTDADKICVRTTSVDEIERLLNDGDIILDDIEGTTTEHESEDLLLEIEQLLDS